MPENFLSMLHSYNQFKRPSGVFGMPSVNRDDGLGEAYEIANQLKNEDLRRQQELMNFQNRLQIQAEQRAAQNEALKRNERTVFGPVNKQRIVQQAPPTQMQQQFRQDELLKDQRAQAEKLALLQGDQRLQQALAVGKLNAERYGLDRESRESIAEGNRTAQNLRAEADRKSREEIAETSRNSVQVMIGPDGKPHAIATNPRDATARALTIDGQPVGDIYNPGTRPKGVVAPEQQKGIDLAADALGEIDSYLLNPDDSLKDEAKWAYGGTAWSRYIPGSPGMTGGAAADRVAAERILNVINHMKSQSRTGATGMGNMSNDDRKVLENAATKLKNPWLDQEVIRKELVKIRAILRKVTKLDDAVSQPGRTQSSFVPDPEAAAKLQHYSTTAGPNETASVYQPTRGALPITNRGPATAPGTLTPQAQESLRILQRGRQ